MSHNSPNHHDDLPTPDELAAANLTAHALGQLHGDDLTPFERANHSTGTEREIHEIQSLASAITTSRTSDTLPQPSSALRERLEQHFAPTPLPQPTKHQPRSRRFAIIGWSVAASLLLGVISLPIIQRYRESQQLSYHLNQIGTALQNYHDRFQSLPEGARPRYEVTEKLADLQMMVTPRIIITEEEKTKLGIEVPDSAGKGEQISENRFTTQTLGKLVNTVEQFNKLMDEKRYAEAEVIARQANDIAPGESVVVNMIEKSKLAKRISEDLDIRDKSERYFADTMLSAGRSATGSPIDEALVFRGRFARTVPEKQQSGVLSLHEGGMDIALSKRTAEGGELDEVVRESKRLHEARNEARNTEQYAPIYENSFLSPVQQPLSTFSIDVDTASYANMRRFLTSNRLPPPDAVRIEELVNYFRYDYPQPKDGKPFSVNMEVAQCPWSEGHLVLRVGLKGKEIERTKRPASNLVFLVDVSGSMADENKLPLLRTALKLLVNELGENDRVSIVTYAGEAGLKLPSARGHEQQRIHAAIDSLHSGGSTNGSAGINLAYEQAAAHFITEGTNRVILCTDGDLNVGVTSDQALVELIKQKAQSRVFLTVLGFGEGNLKDAKMEGLADNGNGLYAYIDSVREAKKVLVEQLTGSTITIAKDVKIQIEFNPAQIAAYRLLGYENRILAAQDFNNDKKDAGEIGAGHTVTALYELVPVGTTEKTEPPQPGTDPLKYQQPGAILLPENRQADPFGGAPGPSLVPAKSNDAPAAASSELLTLKLRYKQPDGDTSQLLEYPLTERGHSFNSASPDFQFAASVASFGMVLRNSQHRGTSNLAAISEIASASLGPDHGGYRAEFLDLIRKAQSLGSR